MEGGLPREQRRDLRRAKRAPRRQAAWVVLDGGCTRFACVLWDNSEGGARIAAARANTLPDVFGLFLTKDGKSRRFCRVAWRKGGQIGVQFVDETVANIDLDPAPAWMRRRSAPSEPAAKNAEQPTIADASQLLLPWCRPQASPEGDEFPFRLSSIAFGMLFLLAAATAVFFLAGIQDDADWALSVCTSAENFCQHPEWMGAAAIAMTVISFTVRAMED
jgi:PilZ domain-containing protein